MLWRKNFVIPNTNYNIIDHPPFAFIKAIPKKNGQVVMTRLYLGFENGVLTGYVPLDELKQIAVWLKEKIISQPIWADQLHQKTEQLNRSYFAYAKSLVDKDLKSMSNQELWEVYNKLRKLQLQGHSHACSTTWFLDSEGEVYSNYLRKELKEYLNQQGIDDKVKMVDYFILLTSPVKSGFVQEEEVEFLELLSGIKEDKKIFAEKPIDQIFDALSQKNQQLIQAYYIKWRWTPYTYIGPAYDIYYYLEKIKETIDNINDIDELITEELGRHAKIKKQQDYLIKQINLSDDLQHLFAIARDIIWLKDFRKYCFWHGHYVLDMINSEVARRLYLSLKQVNHITHHEMKDAILNLSALGGNKEVDEHILNERIRCSIICSTENENKYYWGEEARKIIDSLEIDEHEVDLSAGWQGTCACPGEVKGQVKIVNTVDDIGKVKDGDIMLSRSTYPSFLPAMKKAAAIVTEDGGITCHAAIVAREFRIPCVVGARKITELLKDGDSVEVNATEGLVKKI